MKKSHLASSVAVCVVAGALLAACKEHAHDEHAHDGHAQEGHAHGTPPPPPGTNPVQHEMQLLHDAMREAVTAVATGHVKELPHAFHKVHGAKAATEKAIEAGTWKPPKNGATLDRFRALDEAFHEELEALVSAAEKDDVAATAQALGKAITACPGCHGEFRNPQ